MSNSLYAKLVCTNIKNHRKTYIPYILTAILTVMMYYIMIALTENTSFDSDSLKITLSYVTNIVAVFAVIFLFYTNSFLIKRRKRELGLYNILGMEKRHVAKMLIMETCVIAVISIGVGLLAGFIFSRLMYLLLLKIIQYKISLDFQVSISYIWPVLLLFLGIFLLTLIFNVLQVQQANPIELLRGSSQGEKEPKTKVVLTIFGVLTMGAGYFIALTTKSPLAALSQFFIAVICVILGTYALFTAGSIVLLKMLRRNKSFYYKTNHFSAVSGMIYRMKQNAVGLANICILSTIVLVLVSTSVSLYAGMEDILKYRFPKEYYVVNYAASEETARTIDAIIKEETQKQSVKVIAEHQYHRAGIIASLENGKAKVVDSDYSFADNIYQFCLLTQADYNQLENQNINLSPEEVLVYSVSDTYGESSIQIGSRTFAVAKELKEMKLQKKNKSSIIGEYYVIMKDEQMIQSILDESYANSTLSPEELVRLSKMQYVHSFDLKGDQANQKNAAEAITNRIVSEVPNSHGESRMMSEESFYYLYGGLLFIGIYLGAMFLMATVLIIYYKQISEGYDDKERYQIMQKVGMSKREVKHSIRSQVLIVFFLPLVTAVIHIAVAFPVMTKLLAVLNLVNVSLFLTCTILTALVFALFYTLIFVFTAKEYYKIVN